MIMEYEKPVVELISFAAMESLATDDGDRARSTDTGGDSLVIPSMPEFSEGVEDW